MGTPDSGSTSTIVDTELANPGWGDDYFNEHKYKAYIYAGTNIGEERYVTDWVNSTSTLTLAPVFTGAIATSSLYELHHIFDAAEYLKALNAAIDSISVHYLLPLGDETAIRLTSTTDNKSDTVYTWEYTLPTTMTHVYRITTEEALSGEKLTGTVSGAFTAGETVTGSSSGATGELSYGPAGGTYIRLRKVNGTFTTADTATGADSGETCSSITNVESETSGGSRWLEKDIIDPRFWGIVKSYPSGTPELRLNKSYYSIDEDLYLRLDGHRRQPLVTADTDVIYLPPEWVSAEAILKLPYGTIASNKLDDVVRRAEKEAFYYRMTLGNSPHPLARAVTE